MYYLELTPPEEEKVFWGCPVPLCIYTKMVTWTKKQGVRSTLRSRLRACIISHFNTSHPTLGKRKKSTLADEICERVGL